MGEQSELSLLQTFLWYKIFAKHLLLHNILGSIFAPSLSLAHLLHCRDPLRFLLRDALFRTATAN